MLAALTCSLSQWELEQFDLWTNPSDFFMNWINWFIEKTHEPANKSNSDLDIIKFGPIPNGTLNTLP